MTCETPVLERNIKNRARLFEIPTHYLQQWQSAFASFAGDTSGDFAGMSHAGTHTKPVFQIPDPTVFGAFAQVEHAYLYQIPLLNQFRGITLREGIIFTTTTSGTADSLTGPEVSQQVDRIRLVEFAPFQEYVGLEAARWLASALADLRLPALTVHRQAIPVNVTIPVVCPEKAYELVLNSGGCSTAKVKVADSRADIAADYARIAAVRQGFLAAGVKDPKIRIDVNGLWDVNTAAAHINYLERAAEGLEYVEQPCQTIPELQELKSKIAAPMAIDELIRRSAHPLEDFPTGLAEVAVVKLQPLGGTQQLLSFATRAENLGMRTVVSSALDSSVGIAQALRVAAALPELPHACGLATGQLMGAKVVRNAPVVTAGALTVFTPELDFSLLSEVDCDIASRIENWHGRIMEIYQTLISVFNDG